MKNFSSWLMAAGLCLVAASSFAGATDPHVLAIKNLTQPTGPSQTFTADLVLTPADVLVSSFNIGIGYDNARVSTLQMTNNTGESSVNYTVGSEQTQTGIPYANVFCGVAMDVVYDVQPPLAGDYYLGHITLKTKADFNPAAGPVGISLKGWSRFGDGGVYDGSYAEINVTYQSDAGGSGVSDWNLY